MEMKTFIIAFLFIICYLVIIDTLKIIIVLKNKLIKFFKNKKNEISRK